MTRATPVRTTTVKDELEIHILFKAFKKKNYTNPLILKYFGEGMKIFFKNLFKLRRRPYSLRCNSAAFERECSATGYVNNQRTNLDSMTVKMCTSF